MLTATGAGTQWCVSEFYDTLLVISGADSIADCYADFKTGDDGCYIFDEYNDKKELKGLTIMNPERSYHIQPITLGKPFGDTVDADIHQLGPLAKGKDAPEVITVQRRCGYRASPRGYLLPVSDFGRWPYGVAFVQKIDYKIESSQVLTFGAFSCH